METSGQYRYPGGDQPRQQLAPGTQVPTKPGLLDEAGAVLEVLGHRFEVSITELQEHIDKLVGTAPPSGNAQQAPAATPLAPPQHKQAILHMTFSRLQNLAQWLEREVERVKQL
jgi:hypothetical protein